VKESNGVFTTSESTEFCTTSEDCSDSGSLILFNGFSVDCDVVKANGKCSVAAAASHCPNTCDKCDLYRCADSEVPFEAVEAGGAVYTCATVAGLERDTLAITCGFDSVYSTCRATCSFCS